MATVRINTDDFCCIMDYKEAISGSVEDFAEAFVVAGNRDFIGIADASWYEKVRTMLTDLDCYYEFDEWKDIYSELTDEQAKQIKELYDKCRCTEDIYCDVLNIIYPGSKYVERTIRGYCQGDWQEVMYDSSKINDDVIDLLEAYYFGKIAEIYYEEENCVDYMTDDELWKVEREGTLVKEIRNIFGIDDTEELELYKSNGTVQVIKWEKIA